MRTGGGGGGAWNNGYNGGNGGSGIVIVRYTIGAVIPPTKATGGIVTYYGGKTIHTFLTSGIFETTSEWTSTNVEYVVIGGGGSGGGLNAGSSHHDGGGGGGAGAYRTGTTPIGAHPVSTAIQVGAGGAGRRTNSDDGTPSYFGTPITAPGGGGGGFGGRPLEK